MGDGILAISFRGNRAFLSNFSPSIIEYGGVQWPTVEHAFQAAKAIHDNNYVALIKQAATPREAKRLSRTIKLPEEWLYIRVGIMELLLRKKFSDWKLRLLLLSTKDEELIEENDWGDTFWGVCNGVGENWLGKLLMKIRDEEKKQQEAVYALWQDIFRRR